jgi:hypothetical protein
MKQSNSSQKSEPKDSKNMEHYFNLVKNQDFSESREDINTWLYKADIKIKNKTKKKKLHKMKDFILANKLKVVYTVVALIVVVGACNMPVTQKEMWKHDYMVSR